MKRTENFGVIVGTKSPLPIFVITMEKRSRSTLRIYSFTRWLYPLQHVSVLYFSVCRLLRAVLLVVVYIYGFFS